MAKFNAFEFLRSCPGGTGQTTVKVADEQTVSGWSVKLTGLPSTLDGKGLVALAVSQEGNVKVSAKAETEHGVANVGRPITPEAASYFIQQQSIPVNKPIEKMSIQELTDLLRLRGTAVPEGSKKADLIALASGNGQG